MTPASPQIVTVAPGKTSSGSSGKSSPGSAAIFGSASLVQPLMPSCTSAPKSAARLSTTVGESTCAMSSNDLASCGGWPAGCRAGEIGKTKPGPGIVIGTNTLSMTMTGVGVGSGAFGYIVTPTVPSTVGVSGLISGSL